ncbi:AAA-like domain-containing protein [Aliarcobacter lanthieri]|uniref:AAA-like domain-containing protein n=1 Tax=Aliarcobacter lanthieri TaxID=1355374 RepID=UPI003AFA0ABD
MKKLITTTIIPEHLYIKREADKKLINNISEMGRPASILVSRQMGKTNLLLNTKRLLENELTRFVYIDLSNTTFKEIRDCFRYIIDTAIDTNLDYFEEVEETILQNREKNRLANREHEQELLTLLRHSKKKIIIVLDEIDSMKKYDFSDQFFSQIRSVYFASRSNYDEFNNLTYVLSGVLEPAEIIQDKTKSPFNISDKIYLNDFTYDEFNLFIKNVEISSLNQDLIDYIYEWTSGHPRIVWDICSKLEDIYLDNKEITQEVIKDIIYNMYITHSDTPPIDNIKIIISEDLKMAQSILDIKQNIFLNISDLIKNKLYLYGIIEINYGEDLKIKNKILEENLNDDFLNDIIYSTKTHFERAEEHFKLAKYNEAIIEYKRVLNLEETSKEERNISLINAGLCLMYLGEFDEALKHMKNVQLDKDIDPRNYYINKSNISMCYRFLKHFEESLKGFKEVLNYDQPLSKIQTNLNIAGLYSEFNVKNSIEEMLRYIENCFNLISTYKIEDKQDELEINRTIIQLNWLKATYYEKNKEIDKAKELLQSNFDLNMVGYQPNLLIQLIKIENDDLERDSLINRFFNLIQKKKIVINHFDPLMYNLNTIFDFVKILMDYEKEQQLNEFLNFCQNTYTEYFSSKCSVLYETGIYFYSFINDTKSAMKVFNYTLKFKNNENIFLECYKNIYFYIVLENLKSNEKSDFFVNMYFEYLNFIIDNSLFKVLTFDDYSLITQSIIRFIDNDRMAESKKAVELIDKHLMNNIFANNELFKISFYDIKHKLTEETSTKINISSECISQYSRLRTQLKDQPEYFISYIKRLEKVHRRYIDSNMNTSLVRENRIDRNKSCPCGSGKKYKKCCGRNV